MARMNTVCGSHRVGVWLEEKTAPLKTKGAAPARGTAKAGRDPSLEESLRMTANIVSRSCGSPRVGVCLEEKTAPLKTKGAAPARRTAKEGRDPSLEDSLRMTVLRFGAECGGLGLRLLTEDFRTNRLRRIVESTPN